MQEYRVELDSYSGPLDLLLFLVRRHEIDLHDIPIAQLTQQYLDHLKLLKEVDVELAGEFLVMAATLLEVKSAMLLPTPVEESGSTNEPEADADPRFELVQQLLAYKRYKDAARHLQQRAERWAQRYPYRPARGDLNQDQDDDEAEHNAVLIEIDLEDANVGDLCQAFATVMETIGRRPALHEVVYDDTPISLHAEDIMDRLKRDEFVTLRDLFVGRTKRSEKIGLFLAVLELVRQSKVRIVVDESQGAIRLQRREEDDQASATDADQPADPKTTDESQRYDWPDEEARLRAQRRAKRRAARAEEKPTEPADTDPVNP